MAEPALRAIFFRSTFTPGGLASVVDQCCAVIRREGLRPDVEGREGEVVIYARPVKKSDASAPDAAQPALKGVAP